ncbi:MAG: DUF4126 family protein [Pelobium sp.]
MKLNLNKPFIKVIGLAGIAGMRTMTPLAILAEKLSKSKRPRLLKSNLSFMQSSVFSGLMNLAALGEFLGDKSKSAPNRTDLGGIIGRAMSGALTGATIYKSAFKNPYKGALIGSVSAVIFTYAFFEVRKRISAQKNINKNVIAIAEDALAVSGGMLFI